MATQVEIDSAESALVSQERQLERQIGEAQALVSRAKDAKEEIQGLDERRDALEEAIGVLNAFADKRQTDLQKKIEETVTLGLRTIFGLDLSFHIQTSQRGKAMTTDFKIRSTQNGQVVETPVLEARGGGVAAVVGFLLRLTILLLKRNAEPILFLDETFAQLSPEYEPKLADFMRELVTRTKIQIVLITHSDAYSDVADKVYRFSLQDGTTKIAAEK